MKLSLHRANPEPKICVVNLKERLTSNLSIGSALASTLGILARTQRRAI